MPVTASKDLPTTDIFRALRKGVAKLILSFSPCVFCLVLSSDAKVADLMITKIETKVTLTKRLNY